MDLIAVSPELNVSFVFVQAKTDPTTRQDPDAPDPEEMPPFDRAAIVAAVRSGELSQELAATQVGRTTRTIRRWLAAERSSPA
jgi:hypothetical protein